MPRKTVASAVLILWVTCCVSPAPAQTKAESGGFGAGLANKLDQFGKDLAGVFSPKKSKDEQATAQGSTSAQRSAAGQPSTASAPSASRAGASRVGSVMPSGATSQGSPSRDARQTAAAEQPTVRTARVLRPTASAAQYPDKGQPTSPPTKQPLPETMVERPTRPTSSAASPSRTISATTPSSDTTVAGSVATPRAADQSPALTPNKAAAPSIASDETEARGLLERPLYQRLMGFQQSVFSTNEPASGSTSGEAATSSGSASPAQAAVSGKPPVASTTSLASGVNQPTLAPGASKPTGAAAAPAGSPAEASRIATAEAPAPPPASPPVSPPSGVATATSPVSNDAAPQGAFRHRPTSEAGQALATTNSAPEANPGGADDGKVLFARQSPILSVQTVGPKRIMVGKESAYEVTIENRGQVAANDVVVLIDLPSWADVLGAEASIGSTLSDRSPSGEKQFRWKVGPLEAAARERIVLRIVPRESRPIDLAVKWDFTPVASGAVIEVQEPRLAMRLEGPREVFYAKGQVYKLEISNSGNGEAADMVLTLMPLVPGEGAPASHNLGSLAAGKTKTLEIEMTARQKGKLTIQAELRCDGRVHARLDEPLLVRKAEVAIAVEGPRVQYVGTVAAYQIRVHNGGNAAATNLTVTAKIPPEAKHLVSDDGGKASADGSKVVWAIDRLEQDDERVLQLKCQLVRDGASRMEVHAAGDDDTAATATAATQVDSMADLALEVSDPSGPVPIGQEAVYEIRITNRGTKLAAGVEAIAYFSRGVEPVAVEGSPYTVGPGQVVFDAIGEIAPGKEVILKIKARAETEGNHMFRAEVYCKAVGTKLVGEETTHFYRGDVGLTQKPNAPVQR
jgi:uncharacterized repeat protein (TIGR01451 family)